MTRSICHNMSNDIQDVKTQESKRPVSAWHWRRVKRRGSFFEKREPVLLVWLGLCYNTLTPARTFTVSWSELQTRFFKLVFLTPLAWIVSQHTDASKNPYCVVVRAVNQVFKLGFLTPLAWAVSQHTDASKNTKATSTCSYNALHMWGLSSAMIGSVHNGIHPPEM